MRFAPELHVAKGLSLDAVVEAVLEGFRQGSDGRDIRVYGLLTAMRTAARSLEIAELAVRHRDEGIVGFDIAGAEAGSPPTVHLDAFHYVQQANFHITIHAGEAFGLPSIWEALQICGADRLGHGVRIVDDIKVDADGTVVLGRLASYVRDRRIPLEMCPTSNVQTGAAPSLAEHPIGLLRRLQFRVTVNTDNRLMSGVSLSSELHTVAETFGYSLGDLEWLTLNAMKSAFAHFDERLLHHQRGDQAGLRVGPGRDSPAAEPLAASRRAAASPAARRRGHYICTHVEMQPRATATLLERALPGRSPRPTPPCASCSTACPASTRSGQRRGRPRSPPGRSRRAPRPGRSTWRSG